LASCQNLQYGIQDSVQIFAKIFCKKPQNKIAVLLQEAILSAVSSVRFGIGKMLLSIEFYDEAQWLADKIDFHFALTIEGDRHTTVQLEPTFGLSERFKAPIKKRLAGATRPCHAGYLCR
jgi:hypothetical protein